MYQNKGFQIFIQKDISWGTQESAVAVGRLLFVI